MTIEYNDEFEKQFKNAQELLGHTIYEPETRTTLDKEWEYDELESNVYDIVHKYYEKYNIKDKYKNRALHQPLMLEVDYMANVIRDSYDLIEVYNKEYDKHRNEKKFGITYFDNWVRSEIKRQIKSELVEG